MNLIYVLAQKTDLNSNNNKYYTLELHVASTGETRVFTHYGTERVVAMAAQWR